MGSVNRADLLSDAMILGRTDLPAFAEKYLRIKDLYTRRIVPFKFNPIQRDLWNDHFKYFEVEPIRLAILKYRQDAGFSTFGSAFIFSQLYGSKDFDADIYAQREDFTLGFSEKFKIFNEELPLEIKYENQQFHNTYGAYPDMGTLVGYRTAGGAGKQASLAGRSVGRAGAWFSEVSFYLNGAEVINAVVPSVQYEPRTFVVYETTAGDQDDVFYNIYREAKYERNEYKALFYAWHSNPLHALPLYPGEDLELSTEELNVQQKHHLSLEQMKWRRRTIKMMVGKTKDSPLRAFKKDYPEDDRSCFTGSAFPFFNLDTVDRHHDHVLEYEIKVEYNIGSYVKIYYDPKPARRYSIGADPSEGLPKGDFSAACVLDAENGEQVAVIHGRMDKAVFAKLLNDLGRMYNDAHLVVERNNHGIYTISKLQETYNYPNLYQMEESARRGRRYRDTFGFITSQNSKVDILDFLSEALDDDDVLPNDEETIEELSFFEEVGKKLGAQGSKHDDLVIALALAHKGRRYVSAPIQIYTKRSKNRFSNKIMKPTARQKAIVLRSKAA